MTSFVLSTAWAVAAAAVALRFRPPPRRVRALLPVLVPRTHACGAFRARARDGPLVERVGHVAMRLVRMGRRRRDPAAPPSPVRARQVGAVVVAVVPLLVIAPIAAPPAALVAWALPPARDRRLVRARLDAVAAALPDVVDLLVLAVTAGLTVPLALAAVVARATGPLADELQRALDDVALGRRLADALDGVPGPDRGGDAARPLIAALVASERYGAPLVAGLERLADEVRRTRRRRAEEAARRVPVKLLFPLVLCTLPAFALLTVAPLVAGALRSLRL